MNLETRLRAGIVMLLLSLIILTFFFFQQQDELKKCKSQDNFISGGDIEKEQLRNMLDSLKEENVFQNNQIGLRDMIIEEAKQENPKMMNRILKDTEGLSQQTE